LPIVIAIKGDAYLLVDYCSIFAFMCMGCLFVAIGMFISSLTESQIISAIVTFCILLVVYFWNGLWSLFQKARAQTLSVLLSLSPLFLCCFMP
jgi:ABC-2 type transport system permease protein